SPERGGGPPPLGGGGGVFRLQLQIRLIQRDNQQAKLIRPILYHRIFPAAIAKPAFSRMFRRNGVGNRSKTGFCAKIHK
ncbi:MAG: hypothetical protein LUG44_04100, partial [Clostridiales bacterium]|nr:hypothetical protein [Clostridiales bacterium]